MIINMKTINSAESSVNFYNTEVPDFGKYLLNETFTDATLVCGGHKVSAHRARLSAVSPFLAALFAKDTSEVSVIIIPDVTYEVIRILINFLYTGFIRVSESEVHEVLAAAHILGINKAIDVEKSNQGLSNQGLSNQALQSGSRKRQANGSNPRDSTSARKRRATAPIQTVIIFDGELMAAESSQPTNDPLDVPDMYCASVVRSMCQPGRARKEQVGLEGIQLRALVRHQAQSGQTLDPLVPQPDLQEVPLPCDAAPQIPVTSTEGAKEKLTKSLVPQQLEATVEVSPQGSKPQEALEVSVTQIPVSPSKQASEMSPNNQCPEQQEAKMLHKPQKEVPVSPSKQSPEQSSQCQQEFHTFLKKLSPPKQLPDPEKARVVCSLSLDLEESAQEKQQSVETQKLPLLANKEAPSPSTILSSPQSALQEEQQTLNQQEQSSKPDNTSKETLIIQEKSQSQELAVNVSENPKSLLEEGVLMSTSETEQMSTHPSQQEELNLSSSAPEAIVVKQTVVTGLLLPVEPSVLKPVDRQSSHTSSVVDIQPTMEVKQPGDTWPQAGKLGLARSTQQAMISSLLKWKQQKQLSQKKSEEEPRLQLPPQLTSTQHSSTVISPKPAAIISEQEKSKNCNVPKAIVVKQAVESSVLKPADKQLHLVTTQPPSVPQQSVHTQPATVSQHSVDTQAAVETPSHTQLSSVVEKQPPAEVKQPVNTQPITDKPGPARTTQQVMLSGLLKWKTSSQQQKQSSQKKPEKEPQLQLPPKQKQKQHSVTVISPRLAASVTEQEKRIIEQAVTDQMLDPLASITQQEIKKN